MHCRIDWVKLVENSTSDPAPPLHQQQLWSIQLKGAQLNKYLCPSVNFTSLLLLTWCSAFVALQGRHTHTDTHTENTQLVLVSWFILNTPTCLLWVTCVNNSWMRLFLQIRGQSLVSSFFFFYLRAMKRLKLRFCNNKKKKMDVSYITACARRLDRYLFS